MAYHGAVTENRVMSLGLHVSLRTALALVIAAAVAREVPAQETMPRDVVSAAGIRWHGPLGMRADEPKHWYSLMASGAFRAPTSPAFDSLVAAWGAAHPRAHADVIDVMAASERDPAIEWRSVIVRDEESILNIHLVRAGACEAYTMEVPASNRPLIPRERYDSYVRAVRAAEDSARAERIGIWKRRS